MLSNPPKRQGGLERYGHGRRSGEVWTWAAMGLLEGSWVVISRAISRGTMATTYFRVYNPAYKYQGTSKYTMFNRASCGRERERARETNPFFGAR